MVEEKDDEEKQERRRWCELRGGGQIGEPEGVDREEE